MSGPIPRRQFAELPYAAKRCSRRLVAIIGFTRVHRPYVIMCHACHDGTTLHCAEPMQPRTSILLSRIDRLIVGHHPRGVCPHQMQHL
eukprot:1177235-Prorocentrum_minimum.AAC.3